MFFAPAPSNKLEGTARYLNRSGPPGPKSEVFEEAVWV